MPEFMLNAVICDSVTSGVNERLSRYGITGQLQEGHFHVTRSLTDRPGMVAAGAAPKEKTFLGFLADRNKAWWVYLILAVSLAQDFLVIYGPTGAGLGGLREILGLGLIGFIPGYSSQRAIFPKGELPLLERMLLSIFLSVVVSESLGIVLGFLLLFSASSSTALLTLYTFTITLLAAHRSYLVEKARSP